MIGKDLHNVCFLGIGGIGMSALASYFLGRGVAVLGYDRKDSEITMALEGEGASIVYSEEEMIVLLRQLNTDRSLIVYTPALTDDSPLIISAKNSEVQMLKRSQVLGLLSKEMTCFAVAGTHGKTTTSSILAHIGKKAWDSSALIGGLLRDYNSNYIRGKANILIVEADEYDHSFLELYPDYACITSMDSDHLDIYKNEASFLEAFQQFAELVYDKNKLICAEGLELGGLEYGFGESCDYQIRNHRIENARHRFDLQTKDSLIENLEFGLPGKHNLMNAVAASAMAISYGIGESVLKESLRTFGGVERRFNTYLEPDRVLIDDYAHHPTEIAALWSAVDEFYNSRDSKIAVFQPHLFSRTRDFKDDFIATLSLFDKVYVLPIYPARERPIPGIDHHMLIEGIGNKSIGIEEVDFDKVLNAHLDDVVVVFGAGSIGEMLQKYILTNEV